MQQYKHLFFDLDKTLWDFTENSKITFTELYELFQLHLLGISSAQEFHRVYEMHNNRLWDLYRKGKVKKDFLSRERFVLALHDFGINDERLAHTIAAKYVEISPFQTKLIAGTVEMLNYLIPKYTLHIITNGFNEVQFVKLKAAGLDSFFKTVTTSEEAGVHKPDRKIFMLALQKAKAGRSESLMIGDDISVDILGAREAGIDQVFFNCENVMSDGMATFEIRNLLELKNILN